MRLCLAIEHSHRRPAQVLEAAGSLVAPHCESEFWAEGIGWIPADATLGCRAFEHHSGGGKLSFIEWHTSHSSPEERADLGKVFAAVDDREATEKRLDALFEKMDADKDGKLDANEVRTCQPVLSSWRAG